jgi:hypothetical protein
MASVADVFGWISIGFASLSAIAWIKSAKSKVMQVGESSLDSSSAVGTIVIDGGRFSDDASGGIFLKSKSGWIDLPKTIEIQSRWNARAAWCSAATAAAMAFAELFKMYHS